LFAGLGELGEPAEAGRARIRRLLAGGFVLVTTLAVASSPAMSAWIGPDLWPLVGSLTGPPAGSDMAFEAWIAAFAERTHLVLDIDLAIAEACVASIVVAGAVGLCVHASRVLGATAGSILGAGAGVGAGRRGPQLGIAVLAA